MLIAACTKWVDLRPEVDRLHGTVQPSDKGGGFSAADLSAVEVALRVADAWDGEVVVVCAGPPAAEDGLREVLAAGARIRARNYGVCMTCGVDIPYGRLTAQPEARRCVECEAKHERLYVHEPTPRL